MAKNDGVLVQKVSKEVLESAVAQLKRELSDARAVERVFERDLVMAKRLGGVSPVELEKLIVKARNARSQSRVIARELALLLEVLASGA